MKFQNIRLNFLQGRAYDGQRTPLLINEAGFCIFDLRN